MFDKVRLPWRTLPMFTHALAVGVLAATILSTLGCDSSSTNQPVSTPRPTVAQETADISISTTSTPAPTPESQPTPTLTPTSAPTSEPQPTPTPVPTAPRPTGLRVTSDTDDSVSLSWSGVTNSAVYKVEYRRSG